MGLTTLGWLMHISIALDLVVRIVLAEKNRADNLRRLASWQDRQKGKADLEVVASIVGRRENGPLFTGCLESYRKAGCKYLVVGIDGNEDEDEDMVSVFRDVSAGFLYCHT